MRTGAKNRAVLLAAVAGVIGVGAVAWRGATTAFAQDSAGQQPPSSAAQDGQPQQEAHPPQDGQPAQLDGEAQPGMQPDDGQLRGDRDGFRGERDGFRGERGRFRDMGPGFGGPGGMGPGMGGMGMGPGGGRFDGGYEQWEDVAAFIREHSPKRWEHLQRLPEERQGRVQWFILARYRNLEKLRLNDPEVYQMRLQRLKLEDEIFGIASDLHARGAAPTPEQRRKIREQVTALVDLSLQEREKRIARLHKQIEEEQQKLEADRDNRQTMVERRLREIESQGGGPLLDGEDGPRGPRDGFARPGGPGAPGGPGGLGINAAPAEPR